MRPAGKWGERADEEMLDCGDMSSLLKRGHVRALRILLGIIGNLQEHRPEIPVQRPMNIPLNIARMVVAVFVAVVMQTRTAAGADVKSLVVG